MGSNLQRGGESTHLSSLQLSIAITVNGVGAFLIESLLLKKKKKREKNTSLNITCSSRIKLGYVAHECMTTS